MDQNKTVFSFHEPDGNSIMLTYGKESVFPHDRKNIIKMSIDNANISTVDIKSDMVTINNIDVMKYIHILEQRILTLEQKIINSNISTPNKRKRRS